uniref:Uncharacterized protein n=1 Tax=Alexandrium monilatum TaxID=311494 RepID=A0A7S4SWE9_9DINO|mmetsp:Transcript_53272/g.158879  ORF Transcript_53272/g.158879 Transcript_53272/m.158879 type:complete len:597 (+) Transcript_53272:135-1925(+)
MDPYKVLGLSGRQLKGAGDLDAARHRAKKLFKRYVSEKKKFEAKKVMEAFEMIRAESKNKPGEGAYKILGRSRKERELDKHFNHQTKEIRGNRDLKRALQRARKGEVAGKRIHLPGDKERIPRHRRKKRRRKTARRKHIDALQGLRRLATFLPHRSKFPKVIKLLHRWMRDYMNPDNRDFILAVLQDVVQSDFLTDNPDSRQDVVEVFEYAMGYFSSWFDGADGQLVLRHCWQVATVLACRCYTDDAFVLSATLAKLNEALALLEKRRDELDREPPPKKERRAPARAVKAEADARAAAGAGRVHGVSKAERLETKAEAKGEVFEPAKAKAEGGDAKAEGGDAKAEGESAKDEQVFAGAAGAHGARGIALPVACLPLAAKSPGPSASPPSDDDDLDVHEPDFGEVESLGSSEDVESLGSSDDDVKEEPIDLGSDSDGVDVKEEEEEISSDDSSAVEAFSGSDVEMEECPAFSVPSVSESLHHLRACFVNRCLSALFQHRGPLWARPKIDAFFQDVFYRRSIFRPEQQMQVEAWQSRIKDLQKNGERAVGEANNPLEAHRPVRDSREERLALDADSNVWAAKQTFDSRDTAGARHVIR